MEHKIIVFTDGGARGNPGPAAYGVFICDEKGKELAAIGKAIGISTNNIAEYAGVEGAFNWLLDNPNYSSKIYFYLDSLLVCNQLKGIYKIKNPTLMKMRQGIAIAERKLRDKNIEITYQHIPRAQNKKADALVNKALDE
jgi:ribonuclease HI